MILIIHRKREQLRNVRILLFCPENPEATAEKPILILDNQKKQWPHHSCGVFTNPVHRTSFEFKEERGVVSADIRKIDARFVSLIKWLGENRINVRLSGENRPEGYCVYRIREIASEEEQSFQQRTVSFSL